MVALCAAEFLRGDPHCTHPPLPQPPRTPAPPLPFQHPSRRAQFSEMTCAGRTLALLDAELHVHATQFRRLDKKKQDGRGLMVIFEKCCGGFFSLFGHRGLFDQGRGGLAEGRRKQVATYGTAATTSQ